jgi:lysozyme
MCGEIMSMTVAVRLRTVVFACITVSLVLGSLLPQERAVADERATSWLKGIDISHWQGPINWSKVGNHPISFVIAKATQGQTYNDPNYASYRRGAAGQGIAWTAYHFADPATSANDAVRQADHYVDVAALGSGDLIPALDLEWFNGLTVDQLVQWVKDWLRRVYTGTGVKPMIYTRASFWSTRMGDTTWFANHGYTSLWIANWTATHPPIVPANNWAGHGWTFWQWTDCGSIAGIDGCVDRDRYNGTDLTPATIP